MKSHHPHPHVHHFSDAKVRSRLRLAVVTQFFPPDFAATGQLIEELMGHLSQQGLDIDVFTGRPGYAFRSMKALTVERIGRLRVRRSRISHLWPRRIRGKAVNGVLFLFRAILHLAICCRKAQLLLITTAPPFLPVIGYFINLFFGIPYVCLLYDLYPEIAVRLGVVKERHWVVGIWQHLNRRVWRRAQGIIVLSPAMKQHIVQLCPEVESKVSVIHSWADPDLIVPIPKHQNWFALQHQLIQPFTVLYSGNLGRCHDVETFLEAAILLKDEPVKFVCIGSGAKRRMLVETCEEWGLSNLLLLPYQDKDVLPYSLTACDLSLVSVSPGMERLLVPSKLYSALAAGRPIAMVCPPDSYLQDLVQEAKCGRAIANGDGEGLANFIRQLVCDRALGDSMGKAGRQYLEENFTPQRIADQYLRVLQNMVKQEESQGKFQNSKV